MPSHTIEILASGARGSRRRGPGSCRACGQKIFWCATVAGKPIPFDVNPEIVQMREFDVEEVSAERVHWRTCPKADTFRKPAAPKAPPADRGFEF
jgi:hypothetical protein